MHDRFARLTPERPRLEGRPKVAGWVSPLVLAMALAGTPGCEKHLEPSAENTSGVAPTRALDAPPKPIAAPPKPSGTSKPSGPFEAVLAGETPPHLAFRIAKTYPSQKVTSDGLGHAAGGTWVFFDAVTDDGAPFTFGVPAGPSAPGKDPAFGELVLATSDRARFVAALAKAFGQKVPGSATSARKGQPLKVAAAVLGRNLKVQPDGSYAEGGTATATKLFFEVGEQEAEVFFNFDTSASVGEFSEKDSDYDADLIAIASSHL
jgi:hypothetical protein